jgi:hypothetical protein
MQSITSILGNKYSGKFNKSLNVEGILGLMSCGVGKSLHGVRLGILNIILLCLVRAWEMSNPHTLVMQYFQETLMQGDYPDRVARLIFYMLGGHNICMRVTVYASCGALIPFSSSVQPVDTMRFTYTLFRPPGRVALEVDRWRYYP